MTEEELIVEFALTRLDNPGLDLDEVAALVVRRVGPANTVQFAAQTLADRGELRGAPPLVGARRIRLIGPFRGSVRRSTTTGDGCPVPRIPDERWRGARSRAVVHLK